MPAELGARVSRLGGSRGRSPDNCFPQLGLQLLVITSEAVTSRLRSSPILMKFWSAQRNDHIKKVDRRW